MGLVAGLNSCGSGAAEFEGPYKHVLLISLDTTRADRIACYGGDVAKTPRLDRLAAEGVLFEEMSSAATSTLSSHTSIMTGLYPRRHGVARNGFMVNPDNVTLAEVLSENGFHTAGVIGSFALDDVFDIDQGFDVWNEDFSVEFDPLTADQNQRPGDQVTDTALALVDGLEGDERLFLFAHYFDVHAPYAPPEPFASEYGVGPNALSSNFADVERQVGKHQKQVLGTTRAIYDWGLNRELVEGVDGKERSGDERLRALYDGELAFTDQQVGRLLDGLDERGFLDQCIVVVTGDHGETFWEHGDFWHHGAWVYETNVHVPFIVTLPDGRGAGRRVSEPVSGVDIYPTLLGLLDIPLPEPVAGVSLVESIDGQAAPSRVIFSESTQPTKLRMGSPNPRSIESLFPWANQMKAKSARLGKWKYIQAPYLRLEELYDLEADSEERNNLIMNPPFGPNAKMPELIDPTPESLKALNEIRRANKAWQVATAPRDSSFNSEQMEEVMQKLKDLGYVGEKDEGEEGDSN